MKTKKISIPTDAKIYKKSKDTTYVFKDNCYNRGVTLNFNIVDAVDTIYAKDGDNLFIMTTFGNTQATKKVVTTIVKDYYSFCDTWKNSTTVDKSNIYETATTTPTRVVSGTATAGDVVISYIGDAKKTTYDFLRLYTGDNKIYDIGGNDSYSVKTPYEHVSLAVTDYTGKDNYTLESAAYDILDYNGNDIYTATSNAKFGCKDLSGSDEYYLDDVGSATIRDDSGKDYYEFSNITSDNTVLVYDWLGNDKYKLEKVKKSFAEDAEGNDKYNYKEVTNAKIEDHKGKDKYTFETVSGEIWDDKGNDTYTFTTSPNVNIHDDRGDDKYSFKEGSNNIGVYDVEGDDIYTVENSNEIYIVDGGLESGKLSWSDNYVISGAEVVTIDDADGNEDYRFSNVKKLELNDASGNDFYRLHAVVNPNYEEYGVVDSKGKDKYLVIESEKLKITDEKGNDTYKIQKSKNIDVVDREGNDKYTLENVTRTDLSSILDYKGNDKYTIKSSKAFISDKEGNDTYKITSAKITDGSVSIDDWNETSNDKYTIDKLTGRTAIDDMGGTKDNLTISSAKSKNLIYMANFQKDGKGVHDGSLIIIDKVNGGAVMIDDYFKTQSSSGTTMITSEKDYGCIETIKAGKTNINSKINAFATTTDLAQLSSQVATWLSTEASAFATVEDLFYDGTEAQINAFVAAFSQ